MSKLLSSPISSAAAVGLAIGLPSVFAVLPMIATLSNWTLVAVTDDASSAAIGIFSAVSGSGVVYAIVKLMPAIVQGITSLFTSIANGITDRSTAKAKATIEVAKAEAAAKLEMGRADMELRRAQLQMEYENKERLNKLDERVEIVSQTATSAFVKSNKNESLISSIGESVLVNNGDMIPPIPKQSNT